jgi:methionine-rich copper-binding protein CopC
MPKTTGQSETALPGLDFTTNPDSYAFFFADLTSSVAGVDTLYVADGTGILKFSLNGGKWTPNGSVGGADQFRGLTAVVVGTSVTLYSTGTSGSSDKLYTFTDSSGWNGSVSGSATAIATAGTNLGFRGVAQVPGTIDSTSPTVADVSSTNANGLYKAGDTISITVRFSENVFISGTPRIALAAGSTARFADFSLLTGNTATFTYVVQPGDAAADLDYTATTALSLNGGSIKDAAGNHAVLALPAPGAAGSLGANKNIAVDGIAPTVQSVASTQANGSYKAGTVIPITIQFSEPVVVTGSPQLRLETGTTDEAAIYSTGSGSNTLIFLYTVQAGDTAAHLDYVSTAALELNGGTIRDAAGNDAVATLPSPGASGSLGANASFVIDTTPPAIVSITPNTTTTNGTSIAFTVVFSEPVTGVDAGDFQVVQTGGTGAQITNVTGSGTTWTITVSTGTGDGSIRLDFIDNDTVQDAASNPLGGPGQQDYTGGTSTTVDRTAPSVTSFTAADPITTNLGSVRFVLVFSEPVSGIDANDLDLILSGVSGAQISGISNAGTSYTITVDTGSGDGAIRLDLKNDGSIVDGAGNPLAAGATGPTYTIDKTRPAVLSILATDPLELNLTTVHYAVTFSEAVTGVDSGDFALVTGLSGAQITSVSGSGTSWTVTIDSGTGDGSLRLDLVPDGSIVDAAGNSLTTGATGDTYTFDRTAPSVLSVTLADASPTNAGTVHFTVVFSESVLGVDENDFALAATGVTGAQITGISNTGATYTITVTTGSGDGSLGLNLLNDGSIHDPTGNVLSAGASGPAYTIDRTAPTLVSIAAPDPSPTNAGAIHFDVTFSEAVLGVDAGDFSLLTGGVSGAKITAVTGSGANYSVTVFTGSGDGTIRLDLGNDGSIHDAQGNLLAAGATGPTYAIDKTAPTILSITRHDPSPTNAASVQFDVAFSESVTGVDKTDFQLVLSGVTGAQITSVAGSGANYTINVSTGSGDGTLGLNAVADGSIHDAAANVLAAGLTGPTYTINKSVPTVLQIARHESSPTNLGTIHFDVVFSNSVTGVDAADFALVTSGVSGAKITGVAGSGANYSVAVDTGSGDGSIELDLIDDDSIHDAASNPLDGAGGGTITGPAFTIDKTAPTVTVSPAAGQSDPTATLPIHFTVLFSEAVVGFDKTSVTLSGTAGLGGSTITVTNPGSDNRTFDVAIAGLTGDGTVQVSVAAGAVTDPAGNPNTASNSAAVRYDASAPTVVGIVPSVALTNAATATFTVTFSEAVTGVDTNDAGGFDNFALTTTGLSGAAITAVAATGDPRVYTVTVNTGSGEGTIRLDLMSTGSIVDLSGNALAATHTGDQTLTVDRTEPTALIDAISPDPRNSAVDQITIEFSEAVTGVDPSDFTLTRNGVPVSLSGATISGSGATYTLGNLAGFTGTDGLYELTLVASGSGIQDLSGNALTVDVSTAFTVDVTAPSPTITPPTAGPTNATSLTFTVDFGEDVAGIDTDPTGGFDNFSVTTSGTLTGAAVTGVLAAATPGEYLVFVNTGAGVGNLQLVLAASPAITDAAGNAATGLPLTSTAVAIDTVAPTVTVALDAAQPSLTNALPIAFTVTFDEPVTGLSASGLSLTGTAGLGGASIGITNPSGDQKTYRVAIGNVTADGTVILAVKADAGTDLAGNASLASAGSATVTLDTTPPAVSTPDLAAFSDSGASSSDDITNITTPSFGGTSETGAKVELFEGSTLLGFVASSSGSWLITSSTLSPGSHTVFARATDAAGNVADSGTLTITVDTSAPSLTVARDASQASLTNAQPLVFEVAFNEPVTGFSASGLSLTGTAGLGSASVAITNPLGDQKTYRVSISGITADGTVILGVNAAAAADIAGNASLAAGSTATITLDTTPPAVSTPDLADASDTGMSNTDNITKITTPTFTGTSEAGAKVELFEGSTLLGVVPSSSGNWSITSIALSEGPHTVFARATDAAGNFAASGTLTITIDTTPPAVSAPDLADASDTGTSSTDNITKITTPTFTGTSEAGAKVELFEVVQRDDAAGDEGGSERGRPLRRRGGKHRHRVQRDRRSRVDVRAVHGDRITRRRPRRRGGCERGRLAGCARGHRAGRRGPTSRVRRRDAEAALQRDDLRKVPRRRVRHRGRSEQRRQGGHRRHARSGRRPARHHPQRPGRQGAEQLLRDRGPELPRRRPGHDRRHQSRRPSGHRRFSRVRRRPPRRRLRRHHALQRRSTDAPVPRLLPV